jgi:hypothetical protein
MCGTWCWRVPAARPAAHHLLGSGALFAGETAAVLAELRAA